MSIACNSDHVYHIREEATQVAEATRALKILGADMKEGAGGAGPDSAGESGGRAKAVWERGSRARSTAQQATNLSVSLTVCGQPNNDLRFVQNQNANDRNTSVRTAELYCFTKTFNASSFAFNVVRCPAAECDMWTRSREPPLIGSPPPPPSPALECDPGGSHSAIACIMAALNAAARSFSSSSLSRLSGFTFASAIMLIIRAAPPTSPNPATSCPRRFNGFPNPFRFSNDPFG